MIDIPLVPILQTAIGPAILISGIGLLLLSMTNRLGRVIDRARALATRSPEVSQRQQSQLAILLRRARILRGSILMASLSALCAAFLIIVLFMSALMTIGLAWVIGGLFVACMALLIVSITLFVYDVNQSLAALRLEIQSRDLPDKS